MLDVRDWRPDLGDHGKLHVSSGDWTNYAADVSRRDDTTVALPATTGQA